MHKLTFLSLLNKPRAEIHLYINPADLALTTTEIMNLNDRSELLYHFQVFKLITVHLYSLYQVPNANKRVKT